MEREPQPTWDQTLVIDFETTGLKAGYQAVSIAILELTTDLGERTRHVSLLNPGIPIEPRASEIHGITHKEVEDEPSLEVFLREILADRYCDKSLLVIGHNVEYDLQLFRPYCRQSIPLCTKNLAESLYPNLKRFSLDSLCEHLGVINSQRHSAIADAKATHQALQMIVKQSGKSIDELLKVQFELSDSSQMRFGKYRGLPIRELPLDYVRWLVAKLEPKDHKLREALRRIHGV